MIYVRTCIRVNSAMSSFENYVNKIKMKYGLTHSKLKVRISFYQGLLSVWDSLFYIRWIIADIK